MKLNKKMGWLVIALVYTAVIFLLSLRPCGSVTRSLLKEILQNFMHVPLYAGLAFFLVFALRQFLIGIYPYIYTLIIGISVAFADEYLQSFTPGRTVSKMDIMLDLAGTCLVIGFVKYLENKRKRAKGIIT